MAVIRWNTRPRAVMFHALADIDAATLHPFFDDEIDSVRAAAYMVPLRPSSLEIPAGRVLRMFTPTIRTLKALSYKVIYTRCAVLLRPNADMVARGQNWYIGSIPASLVLRVTAWSVDNDTVEADLGTTDPTSCWPMSNLYVVSKLFERIVSKQLVGYRKENGMLPDLQSAHKAHHSTENATLKVLSDILLSRSRHLWSRVSRPFETFPQFATI